MKSPRLMFGYAVFLVACGVIAYFMAPPDAKAGTALVVSSVTAALMVICAAMAGALPRNRTVGMIGIHAGLVLPLLFAGAFAFRAYSTFTTGGDEKRYLAVILTVMAIGSVISFIAILMTRPAPEART